MSMALSCSLSFPLALHVVEQLGPVGATTFLLGETADMEERRLDHGGQLQQFFPFAAAIRIPRANGADLFPVAKDRLDVGIAIALVNPAPAQWVRRQQERAPRRLQGLLEDGVEELLVPAVLPP